MEPFSLEIRQQHKCSFSPPHRERERDREREGERERAEGVVFSVSLFLSCMWVLV